MPRPTKFYDRLEGKVALVTGAGGSPAGDGIGSAIAELFAAEGAKVAILNRDPERGEYVRSRIEKDGGEAIVTQAEITSDEDCRRAVEQTLNKWGRLDIVVNNAAITDPPSRLESMDLADWDRALEVNLKGPMLMARNALPPMIRQKGGVILNIGSIASIRSTNSSFCYGPAKGGMLSLSRDIAVAYGRKGVRCNTIIVGSVYTPIYVKSQPLSRPDHQERRETRRKVGPLGIEGDAWDIAQPTLYLASDEARFITGIDLIVDAGICAVSPALVPSLLKD